MKFLRISNKSIKEFIGRKKVADKNSRNSNNLEAYVESKQLEEQPSKKNNIFTILERFSLIAYMMAAVLINFMIESISRHSFVEAYDFFIERGHVFLYNSFLIFVTLTLSYLVRKRVFAFMIIGGVWLIGGITNGVILSFRTTPFTGTDLKLISSAASVSTKYLSIDQIILAFLLVVVVIGFFVFLGIRAPKYKGKMRYSRNIVFIILMFASIVPVTKFSIDSRILSTYFGNIVIAYEDYGFPYCFWCTVIAKGMDCPNDYDENEVKNIVRRNGKDSYDLDKTPNIIIVQLESFIDPKLIRGLAFSEDPIPNFRKLEKNFTSGYITVPVVGAGTVNTEFEILTGMSLRYFGPGEYPYKTVMSDNVCESVAYDLKNIGYATHAIHNNVASFYGRTGVFSRLGFDTFTSSEMMNITHYTPIGWAKDSVLTDSIMETLNSSEGQDFVYTITVQSHGGYPTEQILENQKITVSGTDDEAKSNSIEYYVNQLNEVDQFIGDLVEELSNYKEDTVLILFGDHQPSLGQKANDLANGSLFKTEYVIWDNMGLKKKDKNLKAYQLSAFALDKVGIHMGTLMKFHQERMGTKYYYSDLDVLQYDMLYGEKYVYGGESPYRELNLQMGVKDITIATVEIGAQDNIIIKGENFNTSSMVKINDKDVDFKYIDENTLLLPENDIHNGDVFEVDQVSSTGEVLRKGMSFTYKIELPELPPLSFSIIGSNIITDHRRKHQE